jgi:hypothetical protein
MRNDTPVDPEQRRTTTSTGERGIADVSEPLKAILKFSGRGYTNVRHVLVQRPASSPHRASSLAIMVNQRKSRPLLLYLLLLTAWNFLGKNTGPPITATVWAEALTYPEGRKWTEPTVSSTWKYLIEKDLVRAEHVGRRLAVTPRREDGASEYTNPGQVTNDRYETYWTLPGSFWLDGHFARLHLPGIAALLILLSGTSEKPEMWLSPEYAPQWYGISTRTMQRGLGELKDLGLVNVTYQRNSLASKTSKTARMFCTPKGPYALETRRMQQLAARQVAQRRAARSQLRQRT